jgi:hypothetical protein
MHWKDFVRVIPTLVSLGTVIIVLLKRSLHRIHGSAASQKTQPRLKSNLGTYNLLGWMLGKRQSLRTIIL